MADNIKRCGRPVGRKKTAKIEVVLEPAIKEEFMKIVNEEGSTASVEVGRWIRNYIREKQRNDMGYRGE